MSQKTAAQEFGPVPDSDAGSVGASGRTLCCPAGWPQWLCPDPPHSAQVRRRLQAA